MRNIFKKIMLPIALVLTSTASLWAQGPKAPSSLSNPFVLILSLVIVALAIIIAFLAKLVINSAFIKLNKDKKSLSGSGLASVITIVGLLSSFSLFAQDKAAADSTAKGAASLSSSLNGVSETAFYLLGSVVFLEVLIIVILLFVLRAFLLVEKKAVVYATTNTVAPESKLNWWDNLNRFKPIHEEADIDLGHDYDGIRELDNKLPPWWLYGFYCCILFACIYLWRSQVSHTAPSSKEEYEMSVAKADAEKAAYLEKSANNVDENTVKLLTDEANLAPARKTFQTVCAACHLPNGAGNVGPNLTDDYWLHGGSIKDVFKTIKYGWPDKGMKSWKDDFSPIQIAQLASYVKSLHGTNPPNGKAPQGTLYKEEGSNEAAKVDSTKK